MKKIFVLWISLIFIISSCWTTKYKDLPIEKQDKIVDTFRDKSEKMIENIDMSDYTKEEELTEKNLKKLDTKIKEINKSIIEDIKNEEKWVDLSIIEERVN